MTTDIPLVFCLLLVTVALFVSDRLRMDVVAILLIIALTVTGLLTPGEALAGFGDPLVILIAALFVVGEGLFRTGVAFSMGNWLVGVAGTSEVRLLALLMVLVAVLSAFMSNTGAVAIFIPVALNLATKARVPPARLLLPMAYAGSMGGMLTLIGTPPNLAVSTELSRAGMEPFNFFSFTHRVADPGGEHRLHSSAGSSAVAQGAGRRRSGQGPAHAIGPDELLPDCGQCASVSYRTRLYAGGQHTGPGPASHTIRDDGHWPGTESRR